METEKQKKEIYINTDGIKTYVRIFELSPDAPSIIYIITPIGSVGDSLTDDYLKGLKGKSCNIFALDFCGIGRSGGKASDISLDKMKKSVSALIEYIKNQFNSNIHFYGGTGTGGIIAQAIVSFPEIGINIKSLIQYGVCVYEDMSIIGNTRLLKFLYPSIKLLNLFTPGHKIKFKIPDLNGYNAEKETGWYKNLKESEPDIFDLKISLFKTVMDVFLSSHSPIRNRLECPVLVLAAAYDRYYNADYIKNYFNSIETHKELYMVDDSHLAFVWRAEELNTKVLDWVDSMSS